jgi:hypothetical protein
MMGWRILKARSGITLTEVTLPSEHGKIKRAYSVLNRQDTTQQRVFSGAELELAETYFNEQLKSLRPILT